MAEDVGITYSDVRNPRWGNSEQTLIICEVNFEHITDEEYSSFAARREDIYTHTIDIYDRCVAGDFGTIAGYDSTIDPAPITKTADDNGVETGDGPAPFDPWS
tara:strand:- start:32 stop:340 length:309 start_codon:yes stop_codon:yes gene_type:complete